MTKNLTIRINSGKVRGIACESAYSKKEYYSFLGIPYALPPLGGLRFKPPKPVPRWRKEYDATYTRDDCIQYSFYEGKVIGSEDCLYLNVFIPETPEKTKPLKAVVVLIHQGGLQWGSGSPMSNGSPNYFIHHNIIYVTFNYRLHVLGFLNLDTPECPGNIGLKDIVAALNWVQKNIKYFGGDPDNVTLIGNSSGSMIIHLLMMIPQAKGLFNRAMSLGMYVQHPLINFIREHQKRAFELGKLLGFQGQGSSDLLMFLKYQPIEAMMSALRKLDVSIRHETKKTIICSSFLPVIPGIDQFIPSIPSEYAPLINPVPVIFGICENEGTYTFLPEYKRCVNQHFRTAFQPNTWSWLASMDHQTMTSIKKEVRSFYCDVDDIEFPNRAQTDVIISEMYGTFIHVLNKFHPECPVYIYRFEYEGELNFFTKLCRNLSKYDFKGNSHHEDMLYWMCKSEDVNDDDRIMVELVTKLFSNYAKTGNPISEDLPISWRNSTIKAPCYLAIRGGGESTLVDAKINEDKVQFWENLKKKYYKVENV